MLFRSIVAIKQSVHGSFIFSDDHTFHQPVDMVPQTDYTDSIGAGDAFDSGFLTGYLSGWSIEKCARFAAQTAAVMIRRERGTILSSWRRKFEQALESAKAE